MTLRQRLTAPDILIAPGVYDGLTAALATDAGFEALYLSGAAVAYTRLGRPDIGLSTASEMTDTMALIADRTDLPVIMDADTGFGNALNARRTMQSYERAGASALQVEDQTYPKKCGHLSDKSLIPKEEMAGKIAAMADARRHDTLIIARTDAIAVEGFDAAIDRAGSYIDAGADVLFIEAPRDSGELSRIADTFKGRVPLLANMVEGGATPISSATTLEDMGFDIVIFPGGIVRALARSAQDYYASLKATGSNKAFSDRMHDFDGLNAAIGTPEMLALGKRFDGKS
ncbi:MAG: carboxyvinyl-carboxyphosphonate phosphorylmutase [Sulfitobacter sp.]|jgi:2-methylisocitrate lyase-like PEP mutase family enzyme|uniref:isocitrate lyase/PEP mutase family protein n=1 Tax=Sulfitobacter TaxID=60136 RepID=UPI0000669D12|nr:MULTISPECIES: isocitrate lyase/phosphoenolpyruvate mutase family protein [Sulfitobacter]EAP83623.1 isocitrate lyase family protein [Sulfitobacter sp. EE-36]MAX76771.1 carboxyvinyl-carboxyphosphonate phosphorylmutase [Roseobacter sp.]MCP3877255.1 carboxyvinyl-carboxyphosphonate phosphorylmutase [Sulfitobacter sp.]UWR20777.1 isocitrate lyase/phosphoenolpyruvate mutase family protein [Sulfitobacter pontiacus]|tara:strand:- start:350 stop:1210 length:861 start_codon:yes stop_codon:yes gene_type:complete